MKNFRHPRLSYSRPPQTLSIALWRPIYTSNFCCTLQCNFCHKCKLVAILLWFWVQCLLQFPKNRCQVASSFEHVQNVCNITVVYRTEITASLHARGNDATWVGQKLHQNRMCIYRPLHNPLPWAESHFPWKMYISHLFISDSIKLLSSWKIYGFPCMFRIARDKSTTLQWGDPFRGISFQI